VGVFVDQQQLRLASQGSVEIELHQRAAAMLDGTPRHHLKIVKERLGLDAAVGLHDAH
jgi:hypothetical protein